MNVITKKNYHWTKYKVCDAPLFSSLKVRSLSSWLKPQWISKWVHSRWLDMIDDACTNLSFWSYFNTSRLKQVIWVNCLDNVGTRRNVDWKWSIRSSNKHKATYLNCRRQSQLCTINYATNYYQCNIVSDTLHTLCPWKNGPLSMFKNLQN